VIRPEQILVGVDPVDMRWGAERLSTHVQNALGRSPCDGTAYAFANRQRTRIKLLLWDGTGIWLCQRRLHAGRFHWPMVSDPLFSLTPEAWRWLVTGIEWHRLTAQPPAGLRV
jgi:transposase